MTLLQYQADTFVSYTNTGSGNGVFVVSVDVPDLSGYTIAATEWYLRLGAYGSGGGANTGAADINGDSVLTDLSATLADIAPATAIGDNATINITVTIAGGSFTGGRFWSIYPNAAPYQLYYRVTAQAKVGSILRQRQSPRYAPSRVRATDLRAKQTPYL